MVQMYHLNLFKIITVLEIFKIEALFNKIG